VRGRTLQMNIFIFPRLVISCSFFVIIFIDGSGTKPRIRWLNCVHIKPQRHVTITR